MAKPRRYISKQRSVSSAIGKIVLLTLFLLLGHISSAQRYLREAIPFQNTVRLMLSDSIYVVAEISDKNYKAPLNNRTVYYWLAKDTILRAQGTHYGKLLHGVYREFYTNRQPRVQGEFNKGRKTKIWKYWDRKGTLRKISRWKNGKENGRFAVYNAKGKLVQKGRMRNGKIIQGNFLLKTIAKLKHWKVHRDKNNSDENTEEDNNKRLQN